MARRRNFARRRRRRSVRSDSVHRVTRIFISDIAKVAADSGLYRTIQPLNFPIADMIGAFTYYRIKSIKLTYQLYQQLNNNSSFPTLYIAPQQWAESATPSSFNEVVQYKNVKTFQFGPSRPTYSQTFTPHVNMTSTGPGRVPVKSPWLSTSSDLPQHMICVDWLLAYNSTSASTHTIRLNYVAEFEFKGPR
jgi:hypothetical protein